MKTRTSFAQVMAVLVIALAACSDPAPPAVELSRLELRHFSRSVAVKDQIALSAIAFDSRNRSIPTPPLTWTSDDPSIASVDALGRVTGHRLGTVQIRATTTDGEQGNIGIDVRAAELRISLQSGPTIMVAGETAVLRAEMFDAEGGSIAPTNAIRWISGDSSIASIRVIDSSFGLHAEVRANRGGLVRIIALVGAEAQSYVLGVVAQRPPVDAPLEIMELTFFEFTNLSDFPAIAPALRVRIAEGRTAEIIRVEVMVPAVHANTFPPLCTFGALSAGQYEVLGPRHYSWDVFEAFRSYPAQFGEGLVHLTYRTETLQTYGVIARGSTTQGYSSAYASGYRWTPCAS